MRQSDVMVYLMTGFLDSGKTQFLTFTLEQDYFQIQGKTLLILCEEGEEEYDPKEMLKYGVVIEKVEDKEDLTEAWLEEMNRKHKPERVVVEYNGMWPVSDFEKLALPAGWKIEQKIATVDASTFQMYLTNLKPLFVEMVKGAELVLFNRCEDRGPLAGYKGRVRHRFVNTDRANKTRFSGSRNHRALAAAGLLLIRHAAYSAYWTENFFVALRYCISMPKFT